MGSEAVALAVGLIRGLDVTGAVDVTGALDGTAALDETGAESVLDGAPAEAAPDGAVAASFDVVGTCVSGGGPPYFVAMPT
jgi:hypothetical protein